jgi:hypothetical protein
MCFILSNWYNLDSGPFLPNCTFYPNVFVLLRSVIFLTTLWYPSDITEMRENHILYNAAYNIVHILNSYINLVSAVIH